MDRERARLVTLRCRRAEDRVAALEREIEIVAAKLTQAEERGRRWLRQNSVVYELARRAVVPIDAREGELRTKVAAWSAINALRRVMKVLTET